MRLWDPAERGRHDRLGDAALSQVRRGLHPRAERELESSSRRPDNRADQASDPQAFGMGASPPSASVENFVVVTPLPHPLTVSNAQQTRAL